MNKENIVILSGSLPTDKGEITIRTSKSGGAYAVVEDVGALVGARHHHRVVHAHLRIARGK